jgi:hypothetical protein
MHSISRIAMSIVVTLSCFGYYSSKNLPTGDNRTCIVLVLHEWR